MLSYNSLDVKYLFGSLVGLKVLGKENKHLL